MKKILLFVILTSFLFGQSLTKGWYNESFEVPDSLWTKGISISGGTPGSGKVLTSDPTGIGTWQTPGTGEVNTASNQGAGTGVFDNKNVLDLEFRSLVSQNNRLTIGLDAGNKEVDFTVVEANIDHDALANFLATEHFIQSAIAETSALNAGSITSGFGAIDIGADNLTATGTISLGATAFNDNNLTDIGTIVVSASDRHVMEGYATGRNVIRSFHIQVDPGTTPNTDIDCVVAAGGFNASSFTNATDLAASGTSGSFSLSADGKTLTLDLTETVVGVLSFSVTICDMNSSDGLSYYVIPVVSSGNLLFNLTFAGNQNTQSWLDYVDAGDKFRFYIQYATST